MSSGSKSFRRAVFERDNYTCQGCFTQETLTIHHIKPRASHPHLKNVETNGITLCQLCHKDVHRNDKVHWKKIKELSKIKKHKR